MGMGWDGDANGDGDGDGTLVAATGKAAEAAAS